MKLKKDSSTRSIKFGRRTRHFCMVCFPSEHYLTQSGSLSSEHSSEGKLRRTKSSFAAVQDTLAASHERLQTMKKARVLYFQINLDL